MPSSTSHSLSVSDDARFEAFDTSVIASLPLQSCVNVTVVDDDALTLFNNERSARNTKLHHISRCKYNKPVDDAPLLIA